MNQEKGYIYMFCSHEVKLLYNTDFIEKQLISYCNKNNIQIIDMIIDVTNDRPNLFLLLNNIKSERLICWSISHIKWDLDKTMKKKLTMINLNILTMPLDTYTTVARYMLNSVATYEEYIFNEYLNKMDSSS